MFQQSHIKPAVVLLKFAALFFEDEIVNLINLIEEVILGRKTLPTD